MTIHHEPTYPRNRMNGQQIIKQKTRLHYVQECRKAIDLRGLEDRYELAIKMRNYEAPIVRPEMMDYMRDQIAALTFTDPADVERTFKLMAELAMQRDRMRLI